MCNVCCKELQGWCRAFTATEVILSILQAILLTLFVAFLTFIILHFIACSEYETNTVQPDPLTAETSKSTEYFPTPGTSEPENVNSYSLAEENKTMCSTVPLNIECTWSPSAKTNDVTQYFEHTNNSNNFNNVPTKPQVTPPLYDEYIHTAGYDDGVFVSSEFDGEPASIQKTFIMALVKMRPPHDVTFGCILTIVTEFWTLTAASCIESIEEVDSLDSFVMMENFGEARHGKTHEVSNVLIHPQYQGRNKAFDIVALKSENKLTNRDKLLTLPTLLDYLLITIGERLTILGFGKFRSIDRDAFTRGVHAVSVHVLPNAQCATHGEAWSARHLVGGLPTVRMRCGVAALCAGPLFARGTPCNYCAGTPLLQERLLLGLMSDPGPCGAPCEPALYVNLAASLDWLNSVLRKN